MTTMTTPQIERVTLTAAAMETLRARAAAVGVTPEEYASRVLERALDAPPPLEEDPYPEVKDGDWMHPESRAARRAWAVRHYKLDRKEPDGTNGLHRVIGMWPGDETEEELLAMEKRLDDEDAGRV